MKKNRKILNFTTIMVLGVFLSSCAIYHHYGPYYGKIVDSETKQPLEGVAVLAVYYTQQYGLAGANDNYLDAQETVTDKNGEFKIPSLNSFAFRPLQTFESYAWFTIFKPAYGCYPNNKKVKTIRPNGTLPVKEYVTIELPRLLTKEERMNNTDCFPISIPDINMKKIIEINNMERKELGLKPTHLEEERKQ